MRPALLETLYNLFDPTSRSRPAFSKQVVFVADVTDVVQPLGSAVTIAKARKALGIKAERIAGRHAWHAPVLSLNHALRFGDSPANLKQQYLHKTERLGKRLAPDLRQYIVDQGLAVPYYEAMSGLKQYRIDMHLGRGFSYTAFSSAVRQLNLSRVTYNKVRYYLLKHSSTADSRYDPRFEELVELVDILFDERKSVPEKEILAATAQEGFHPAAVSQVDGFRISGGMWHLEGEKETRVYDVTPPWEKKR